MREFTIDSNITPADIDYIEGWLKNCTAKRI